VKRSDWPRLIEVRERQKTAAAQALAAARSEADHSAARCNEAQRALASRADERRASWHGAVGQFAAGALQVEQLRRAGSFDAVASRRILEANRHCSTARTEQQLAQARSDHAHAWLRGRCAALEKAQRMDERAQAERRQREERQAEESAEAAALAAWLRRPRGTTT
jgi:hypothetical protein